MIAAAALTTSQVLRNISSACMEMRLRPDRPAHRHPRHPRHPPNPYRAWPATGAANREGASQVSQLGDAPPLSSWSISKWSYREAAVAGDRG